MDNCMIQFTYLRLPVNVEFKHGNAANGVPACYSTDNKFIQDAIENDRRFTGGRIKLVSTNVIKDENELKAEAKAKAQAAAEESQPRRVIRPKTPFVAKEEPQAVSPESEYEAVKSVKTVNDAIAYFTEKGEAVTSDEELATLKDKYKVTFPNLK